MKPPIEVQPQGAKLSCAARGSLQGTSRWHRGKHSGSRYRSFRPIIMHLESPSTKPFHHGIPRVFHGPFPLMCSPCNSQYGTVQGLARIPWNEEEHLTKSARSSLPPSCEPFHWLGIVHTMMLDRWGIPAARPPAQPAPPRRTLLIPTHHGSSGLRIADSRHPRQRPTRSSSNHPLVVAAAPSPPRLASPFTLSFSHRWKPVLCQGVRAGPRSDPAIPGQTLPSLYQ